MIRLLLLIATPSLVAAVLVILVVLVAEVIQRHRRKDRP